MKTFINFKNNIQVKKFLQYGIGQAFNVLVPFIIIPFIILKCGEENFGKSAVAMSIAFFLIVFIDFGCDILAVKDISINRDNLKKRNFIISRVIYIKGIFILLFSILFIIVICEVDFFYKNKELYFFTFPVFIAQIINPQWIFQGLEKFNLFSYFSILSKSIYLVLVFYFLNQKSDYIYINLAFGLSIFLASVFFFYFIKRKFHFNFVAISFTELFKYMLANRTYVFSQIFIWMQLYSPILLVNFFGTNMQVGQFRIIDQIISVFKTYILLSFNFIYPKICFEFDQDEKKALKSWKIFNAVNFLFILFLLILIFAFSFQIINYYNVIDKSYLVNLLKIAILYPVVFFIVYAFKQLLLALHYEKIFSKVIIVMSILNLTIISIVYKNYSLFGVFYSFIFVELLTLAILVLIILQNKILHNESNLL